MSGLAPPRPRLGFAVQRHDLKKRADANYARLTPTVADLFKRIAYPMVGLDNVLVRVDYGTSSRAVLEELGPPMLRMVNLRDGDWDMSDLKFTTLGEQERKKYALESGDILFNRTNSKELVGKCAVFREQGEWTFAGYLIRLRLGNDAELLPEFVSRFLNSTAGRSQIDQVSRQIIGMANINATEIRELGVPRPPLKVQRQMVDELANEWTARQASLARFRKLLAVGDRELAEELGVDLPEARNGVAYAATRWDMRTSDRANAEFFHPERVLTVRALHEGATPVRHIDEVADRTTVRVASPGVGEFYVGLANVERDTGELVLAPDEEAAEGASVRFKAGDVLFSKLRPYLNKVHLAERAGVCSPEFLVLRPKPGVRGEYLEAVLRSRMVLDQTRHMAGGNTHPRLVAADVNALLIPLPQEDVQHQFADEAADRRAEAQALKVKAEGEWSAAKQRFGDSLVRS